MPSPSPHDELPPPRATLLLAVLAVGLLGAAAGGAAPARMRQLEADLLVRPVGACATVLGASVLLPCEDLDEDGISDEEELALETDPADVDSDGDGLSDALELLDIGSSPIDPDSDNGGVDDADESARGTSPTDTDDDGPPLCFNPETGGTKPCA